VFDLVASPNLDVGVADANVGDDIGASDDGRALSHSNRTALLLPMLPMLPMQSTCSLRGQ
jgi:hypothetical protein